MIRKLVIGLFLYTVSVSAFTQNSKTTSSLQDLLVKDKQDTGKVNRLNNLAEADEFANADTAIKFAEQAYALADSLHYRAGMAFATLLLNGAYNTLGNYRLAL
jgi:hypothetical protein